MEAFEPRYEPLVIKTGGATTTSSSSSASASASAPNEGDYLLSLQREDWESRRPVAKTHWSVLDYHHAYVAGELTPTAVAKALLPLINRDVQKPHQHSTAYLQVREDLVLKAAGESTKRYAEGRFLSVLDGVPVAVKDEMDLRYVRGEREQECRTVQSTDTRDSGYSKCFGSKIDYTRADDATSYCVQKWLDAGAMVVGKTTMHEMGADTTNNNPNFGTPLNPYNENYYTGGSSGGSAYSVAAGLTPLCEGNDGGGSIRLPANYCGVFGLKPSQGRISGRPSTNLAKSNGVSGPIAANMIDLEIGYRIMAQPDALDPTSCLFTPPGSVSKKKPLSSTPKLLGIYKPWFDRADPIVKSTCQASIDHLTTHQQYQTIDISIPLLPEGQLAHAMTILAELATGVSASDQHLLTPANKVLISVARKTTAVDFLQAQRLRNLLMQHLAHLFHLHPGLIIVTPTTPNAGWRIGAGDLSYGISDANQQVRNMEYVWLANFTGCPALTAPVGYHHHPHPHDKDEGIVPIGLMGMAEWCEEDALLEFGYHLEEYLRNDRVRPKVWENVLELAGKREE